MNDAFYEQLVTRKTRPLDVLIRILIILFIAAVAVVGTLFIGFLAFFMVFLLAIGAYYFILERVIV